MRRSKAEIYLHLVWATNRLPALTGTRQRTMYRCIEAEALKLHCQVLALGGMPDHVHLLVKAPTTLSAAALAKQVKGVSSLSAEHEIYWQPGYGVFSISPNHVGRVIEYVQRQAEHHRTGTLASGLDTMSLSSSLFRELIKLSSRTCHLPAISRRVFQVTD